MRRQNKVYSLIFAETIVAAAHVHRTFEIRTGKPFNLKSVLFNDEMQNLTIGGRLNEFADNTQTKYLLVGYNAGVAPMFTNPFQNLSAGFVPAVNGMGFLIHITGQYHFESFFVNQLLPFEIYLSNQDILNTVGHTGSVVVEIEELD